MDEPKDPRDVTPPTSAGKVAKPADRTSRSEREAKLAVALRANLRRRRAAAKPAKS
jgi:hypothetical protein